MTHVYVGRSKTFKRLLTMYAGAECEYGDRASADECSRGPISNCYDDNHRSRCCGRCAANNNGTESCEFGDRASWCPTIRPSDCYSSNVTCCQTCARLRNNTKTGKMRHHSNRLISILLHTGWRSDNIVLATENQKTATIFLPVTCPQAGRFSSTTFTTCIRISVIELYSFAFYVNQNSTF